MAARCKTSLAKSFSFPTKDRVHVGEEEEEDEVVVHVGTYTYASSRMCVATLAS